MAVAKPDMTLAWGEDKVNNVQPADAKMSAGWIAEKPPYQHENWMQNRTDEYLQHIDERGVPGWASQSIYILGGMCFYSDQLWESLQVDNENHVPADGGGWWQSWQPLDKLRGGLMEGNIIMENDLSFQGTYADDSIGNLLALLSDDNVYVGAITDPAAQNTETHLMQGAVSRVILQSDNVEFFVPPRWASDPIDDNDLVRKSFIDNSKYESAAQIITSAGALTLGHGLVSTPKFIQLFLKCIVTQYGYAVDDVVSINPSGNDPGSSTSAGASITYDGTNIYIKYGSAGSSFRIISASSYNAVGILNTSWKLIVRAWT